MSKGDRTKDRADIDDLTGISALHGAQGCSAKRCGSHEIDHVTCEHVVERLTFGRAEILRACHIDQDVRLLPLDDCGSFGYAFWGREVGRDMPGGWPWPVGLRDTTVTSAPALVSSAVSGRPSPPLPPVRKILCRKKFIGLPTRRSPLALGAVDQARETGRHTACRNRSQSRSREANAADRSYR